MKKAFWVFGTALNIIIDELETEGRYDLILGNLAAGVQTPLHKHNKYSETIFVLEGEFTVYTESETRVLQPGDNIHVPQGVAHVVANSGFTVGKALTVASPSGFAELIRSVGIEGAIPGVAVEQDTDMALFMELSERIGDVILGPPGSRP